MKCPVCTKEMKEQDFGGINVDVCKDGCKGIWFDWFELSKLDETNEGFGKALKEALEYPRSNDEDRGRINCPKCGIPMHIHKYKMAKEVNVDECYACAGFFLDSGELKEIRETYMSPEEVEAYQKKLLAGIPGLAEAQKDVEKEKKRAEAIYKYTKYMTFSYYMKKNK